MKKNKEMNKEHLEIKKLAHEFAERFKEIHKLAKQHGIFMHDRETLICSKCGLTEDIAFTGVLFTHRKDDAECKDTGLQFIALDDSNERFICPVCSTEVIAPNEKE